MRWKVLEHFFQQSPRTLSNQTGSALSAHMRIGVLDKAIRGDEQETQALTSLDIRHIRVIIHGVNHPYQGLHDHYQHLF